MECGAMLLLLLPTIAMANPRQDSGFLRANPTSHHKDSPQPAVHYKYQYAVDDPVSGVVNDRWEQRSGDFVKGQYSLLDPDGKVRTVDYEVDGERGFHAVIRTKYPAPSLLSIQSASQVQEVYQDPPVNVRAKSGLGVPDFAVSNPRFSVRDNLPFNYHALNAAKLGISAAGDGEPLQRLDGLDDEAVSPREAQRRKYHRDNHLLAHERFGQQDLQHDGLQDGLQHDLQDGLQDGLHHGLQDGLQQDLHEYNTASTSNGYAAAPAPSHDAHVYNPRAAYISLRPRPPPQSPLPPPNPPPQPRSNPQPVDFLFLQSLRRRSPPPGGATNAADVAAPVSAPGSPFLFGAGSGAAGLHTLAFLHPPPLPQTSPTAHAYQNFHNFNNFHDFHVPQATSRSFVAARPPRIVQHLTETSPGLSASRSYYL